MLKLTISRFSLIMAASLLIAVLSSFYFNPAVHAKGRPLTECSLVLTHDTIVVAGSRISVHAHVKCLDKKGELLTLKNQQRLVCVSPPPDPSGNLVQSSACVLTTKGDGLSMAPTKLGTWQTRAKVTSGRYEGLSAYSSFEVIPE